jgi:hypothetical protein
MHRKAPEFSYLKAGNYPHLDRLIENFGQAEVNRMLGITAIGEAITKGRVRPVYEMSAELLLQNAGDVEPPAYTNLIVRVPSDKLDAVRAVVDALGLKSMRLEL